MFSIFSVAASYWASIVCAAATQYTAHVALGTADSLHTAVMRAEMIDKFIEFYSAPNVQKCSFHFLLSDYEKNMVNESMNIDKTKSKGANYELPSPSFLVSSGFPSSVP